LPEWTVGSHSSLCRGLHLDALGIHLLTLEEIINQDQIISIPSYFKLKIEQAVLSVEEAVRMRK
jgi:hypothetical protein